MKSNLPSKPEILELLDEVESSLKRPHEINAYNFLISCAQEGIVAADSYEGHHAVELSYSVLKLLTE